MAQIEVDVFTDKPAHQELKVGQDIAELKDLRP
jgi:hypothetical protein